MTFSEKLLVALAVTLLSFTPVEKTEFTFKYPEKEKSGFAIRSDLFKKFDAEWAAKDFIYTGSGRGFLCSFHYKVIDKSTQEKIKEVRIATTGPEISPMYAYTVFENIPAFKSDIMNNKLWGKPTDDIMFRQFDVNVYGTPQIQKNMFAYAMITDNLFAELNIQKINCSSTDSLIMMDVLKSFHRIK